MQRRLDEIFSVRFGIELRLRRFQNRLLGSVCAGWEPQPQHEEISEVERKPGESQGQ